MGSVLAFDNSGSNWLRHGSARKHLVSMQVVLADGEALEAGRPSGHRRSPSRRRSARRDIVRRLAELIDREQSHIQNNSQRHGSIAAAIICTTCCARS